MAEAEGLDDLELAVRNDVAQGVGLTQVRAARLLRSYDAAVLAMETNFKVAQGAARMCREARHVADLLLATLKIFYAEKNGGIHHLIQVVESRYSWLKTRDVDYQAPGNPWEQGDAGG